MKTLTGTTKKDLKRADLVFLAKVCFALDCDISDLLKYKKIPNKSLIPTSVKTVDNIKSLPFID